ncbi:hypothetical protein B0E33_09935 [Roseibium algicola]|uniref:Uncharacterized protein n=1 Tax=Roseibium algicola TaxID=2857014 RepID=A0ABM6I0M0_9HYPH|nr:hypothetical protein B0E33_09935 [Roseibium aggregatum]
MKYSLRQLDYRVAVAEHGCKSVAADGLHVAQLFAHKQIQNIALTHVSDQLYSDTKIYIKHL